MVLHRTDFSDVFFKRQCSSKHIHSLEKSRTAREREFSVNMYEDGAA